MFDKNSNYGKKAKHFPFFSATTASRVEDTLQLSAAEYYSLTGCELGDYAHCIGIRTFVFPSQCCSFTPLWNSRPPRIETGFKQPAGRDGIETREVKVLVG
jgi:hypothetical protein